MPFRILAVGTLTSTKYNFYSGQATMFEGFVEYLKAQDKQVDVVNIFNPKRINRKHGVFSFMRSIDYLFIISTIFIKLLFNRYKYLYITTAQSKVGFYRDRIIINLCVFFGLKVIAHQFGANYANFYNNLSEKNKMSLKKVLLKTDKIIVEGDFMKDQFSFLDDYKDRVVVVFNSLPGDTVRLPYKRKSVETNLELVFLSNMIISKGYLDVLFAVEELINHYKVNLHCTFVGKFTRVEDDVALPGNVSPEEFFYSFINEKGLEKRITHFDGLYGDAKRELFLKTHVFLLPSYFIYEGQPVSIIEAMAYGNVPIVTNYRHIPCMVSDENGFFVKPKTPGDIVNKILLLLEDSSLFQKMSEKNIRRYNDEFIFDRYCSKLISFFK